MEELFVNIAGFNLKIEFHPFIKYGSPHQRQSFIKNIKKYLKNFTLTKEPKILNFTVQAVTTLINYVEVKQPDTVSFILFKKINETTIETYTYLNVLQFQAILQDIIFSLTVKNNGFVIHASAVAKENKAYLFLGKPTAGKSTAIRLLKDHFQPIADDTIIIKKESGKYYAYQTPFIEKQSWLQKESKQYELTKVFFLNKSKTTSTEIISEPTRILDLFLDHILISSENNEKIIEESLILIKKTNFYILNFRKNKKELINASEQEHQASRLDV